jgi:NADPH:quinone reductase-like Zn-dependent oxidoreductase
VTDAVPERMRAVLLTGHGGYDKLVVREDVAVARPGPGDVLIGVAAAALNNTDVNTRTGWYSTKVRAGTNSGAASGFESAEASEGAWTRAAVSFPRIQGADCCGRVVAVGEGVDETRIGERVVVRPVFDSPFAPPPAMWWFGADCDGAFAEYCVVPATEAYRVECDWDDAELAAIPCAFSTAENMLHRANVSAGERVLVTGASGGVGSAAVQLAKRRGAEVVAVASASKAEEMRSLGADTVFPRGTDLERTLGREAVDAVIDLVGGMAWGSLLEILRPSGRLAISGAIAGPIAEIDLRTLYLHDLTVLGCTYQEREVFDNLIGYVERSEIRPVVASTYPLEDIVQAQRDFVEKGYVGKLVLTI